MRFDVKRVACIVSCMLACMHAGGISLAGQATLRQHAPVVDPAIPDFQPQNSLIGSLAIQASPHLRPVFAELVRKFLRWHPHTPASLQNLSKFGAGYIPQLQVKLIGLTRQLTSEESSKFLSRFGYRLTEIPIGRDAVALYVHRSNPLKGLSLAQVEGLFSTTPAGDQTVAIQTWGGTGLAGGWSDLPVHPYIPTGRDLSDQIFFRELVLRNRAFLSEVEEKPGSASVVLAVARDPLGIGVADMGMESPFVKVVPISKQTGMPYIAPTVETIGNGTYSLTQPFYLYVNKPPTEDLDPVIGEFLKFIHSREGQQLLITQGRFPLKSFEVRRNLQVLNLEPEAMTAEIEPRK